jgi:Pentapeptide repeats (9 copies)
VNPQQPAIFEHCSFRDVRFETARATRATLASSRFVECQLQRCYFGPATLDLRGVAFRGCKLTDVTFMLGKLAAADFSGTELVDVYFRRADLTSASFRDTTLKRVSFEQATLLNADFTGCRLIQGDFWGEPPWQDAIVADEVRYSFAIIEQPFDRIDQLLESKAYLPSEREHLLTLRKWLDSWVTDRSAVMLAYRELDKLFDRATFTWLLKQLRGAA